MDHKSHSIIGGPLNMDSFPKGMGNSRGITGMKLNHAGIPYKPLNAVLCAQGKEY